MRKLIVVSLVLCLAAAAAAQQRDFSKITIKVTPVAGNVYMLVGEGGFAGGNIGVSAGEDGILIVDDQFAPLAPKIREAMKSFAGDKPVKYVLNTHWHGDHVHGNLEFGKTSTILAHENVRKRMADVKEASGPGSGPTPKHALPVVTFREGVTVHINGDDIRALHAPSGHTDGDSIVYFTQANVVHMGDQFFNGMFPFIDLRSGGSVRGYVANLERVVSEIKPDTKVIPGHGPLGTVEDLKKTIAMLRDVISIVERGIQQGKKLEQLKAEKALAKYESWNWEFISADRMLETVYNDLAGERQKQGAQRGGPVHSHGHRH